MADQGVVRAFKKAIRVKQASARPAKALLEAGITESGLRNLNYGDRDSLGALQQRPSSGYKHPLQPFLAAVDFLNQAERINRAGFHGSAGQLAQAVQRSAFPGRYDQHAAQAARFLAGTRTAAGPGGTTTTSTTTSTGLTPQAVAVRKQALLAFLNSTGSGGNGDPVKLAQTLAGPGSRTQTTRKVNVTTSGGGVSAPAQSAPAFQSIFEKAAAINNRHLPYQWGGGHGPTPAKPGVPVDCSGAVSEALGVSPRVAAQFKSYGQAGRGRQVTIWAAKDGHHVLMEINGHFWGTSATNPGGGAGWIPRAAISSQYLQGFVARHPPGL